MSRATRRPLAARHPLAKGDHEQRHHESADECLRRGQGPNDPDLTRFIAVSQGGEGNDAVIDAFEEGDDVGFEPGAGEL